MNQEQVKKKRTRKKTCEIDSIEKLKVEKPKVKPKPTPTPVNEYIDKKNEDMSQSQISFGKFNITVKKTTTMSVEELRNYYDKKFEIKDSEKTAKLMVQDEIDENYNPIMEDNVSSNSISVKKIDKINNYKILSKFVKNTEECWPKKTDILCWWCSHSFDNNPLPCPVVCDSIRNRYKVNGVFCSWSCVAAYSIKEYSSLSLVYKMKNDCCSNDEEEDNDKEINVAPSKYILNNFGGYMSIDDYRALDYTKSIILSTENLSYINQDILEIKKN